MHLNLSLIVTQKICNKAVNTYHSTMQFVPDCYKTQEMCDKAVDDCPAALKSIPDWFGTCKMLEKCDNSLHANDDILFYNEDFNKVTFIANKRHILAVELDKITVDNDNSFCDDAPANIIHVRLLA